MTPTENELPPSEPHKGGHMGNTHPKHAVKLLEEHTERKGHAPHVGGHKVHTHSGCKG